MTWTGEMALRLLPENNGPKVEVYRGLVVSPLFTVDDRVASRELTGRLRPAARRACPEVNLRYSDELFVPDLSVFRESGAGKSTMDIVDAVMLVERLTRQPA